VTTLIPEGLMVGGETTVVGSDNPESFKGPSSAAGSTAATPVMGTTVGGSIPCGQASFSGVKGGVGVAITSQYPQNYL